MGAKLYKRTKTVLPEACLLWACVYPNDRDGAKDKTKGQGQGTTNQPTTQLVEEKKGCGHAALCRRTVRHGLLLSVGWCGRGRRICIRTVHHR